jgi:signal transduction histidine kinase
MERTYGERRGFRTFRDRGGLRIIFPGVALALAATLSGAPVATAEEPENAPTVVVIYASFRGFSPFERFHNEFVTAVRAGASQPVDVQAEFLDAMITRGEEYDRAVTEYLRRKYARNRVVAVVSATARAAMLATKIRRDAFPTASLVCGYVDQKILSTIDLGNNVTSVTGVLELTGTAQLAVRLLPDTKYVAFVIGSSEIERAWYERAIGEVQAGAPGVEVIKLLGLPKEELLQRLRTLPEHSVVLWATYFRDTSGLTYAPSEMLAQAQKASNAPLFGLFDYDLGGGIVGGRIGNVGRYGSETGNVVARIVNGEPADSIAPVHLGENPVEIDWRALQRWRIDPRRLPPDAVVSFREPTVWEEYGTYIVVAAAVLFLETLLLVGLMIQRSRRLRIQDALAERLRVERLIADLSTRFVDLPVDEIDSALTEGLEEVRDVYRADRVTLLQFDDDPARRKVVCSAVAPGIEPLPEVADGEELSAMLDHIGHGEWLEYSSPEEIPARLSRVRESVALSGVRSGIVVPLHSAGTTFGSLGVAVLGESRRWSADAAPRLTMVADIFANVIGRKNGAAELNRIEALKDAVLGSITAQVCVLDRGGRIVAVNDAWRHASDEPGRHLSCVFVGGRCPAVAGSPAPCAAPSLTHARVGLHAVLEESVQSFSTEYRVSSSIAERWYELTVEGMRVQGGGAIMSHQDVTSRKRAELEAEQRRQELAHVSRVSTLGELAASIAHELNQPLTGVLTNAQTAVRCLSLDPPNVAEVREILTDIIEDDRRASEVIRRLRSMLRTGAIEPADVNVNEIVGEVLKLLGSDAVLRNVVIETDFAVGIQRVRGDPVQLQQVVLNLVVNAMDAMKETEVLDRRVTIRTMSTDPSTVLITVADLGPGIPNDKLGRIFQPFFTTKREGLGMGLSIARTIIEAHGGMLWAVNNPDRGASFLCRLPTAANSERHDDLPVPG